MNSRSLTILCVKIIFLTWDVQAHYEMNFLRVKSN